MRSSSGVLCGQQQHRQLRALLAKFPQYVEPAHVGQHHVENDDVRPLRSRGFQGCRAVAGGGDVPAFVTQSHRDHLGEDGFVVDHQHIDRVSVGAAHDDAFDGGLGLAHNYPVCAAR